MKLDANQHANIVQFSYYYWSRFCFTPFSPLTICINLLCHHFPPISHQPEKKKTNNKKGRGISKQIQGGHHTLDKKLWGTVFDRVRVLSVSRNFDEVESRQGKLKRHQRWPYNTIHRFFLLFLLFRSIRVDFLDRPVNVR